MGWSESSPLRFPEGIVGARRKILHAACPAAFILFQCELRIGKHPLVELVFAVEPNLSDKSRCDRKSAENLGKGAGGISVRNLQLSAFDILPLVKKGFEGFDGAEIIQDLPRRRCVSDEGFRTVREEITGKLCENFGVDEQDHPVPGLMVLKLQKKLIVRK